MSAGALAGRAEVSVRGEQGRVSEALGVSRRAEHAAKEGHGVVGGGALGEGTEEGVVHEGGGVGGVEEEEEGVGEIAGGGGGAEVEEAAGRDWVVGEAGFDDEGVELVELCHGIAFGFEEG